MQTLDVNDIVLNNHLLNNFEHFLLEAYLGLSPTSTIKLSCKKSVLSKGHSALLKIGRPLFSQAPLQIPFSQFPF